MKPILALLLLLSPLFGAGQSKFHRALSEKALSLTLEPVTYDPKYYVIGYPNGDVPRDKGVCTDVVIRAYRKLGIDLQQEVHRDMTKHFSAYPNYWGLNKPDPNIDHRRVPNLMVFFKRKDSEVRISAEANQYLPGDIVCWDLGRGLTHIGLVAGKRSGDGKRPLIVHNIGAGQVVEDCLFKYRIIGHYRYPDKDPAEN